MGLTSDQVSLIKSTVPILRQYGKIITTTFYDNMLSDHPELNHIFNRTNQVNGHQASALAGSLYAYASNIDDLGVLAPAVEKIVQKHASLYIQPEQYDVVGYYLLKAMKIVLGDALTEDIQSAWAIAYQQLANLMMGREQQLYKERLEWTNWRDFTIVSKVTESSDITSFYLKPVDDKPLPSYHPGQYISIRTTVPQLNHLQSRQYSLSDAPSPTHYRISVKKEAGLSLSDPAALAHPGYVSNVLHDSKHVGDTLQVSHPAGEFYYTSSDDDSKPIALISAGVGLTPMLSILRTRTQKVSTQPISWIHATRNSRTHAFSADIRHIAEQHPNVRTRVFMSQPSANDKDYQFAGRMKLGALDPEQDLFLGNGEAVYFICGPERFMSDVREALVRLGVESQRIRMEVFGTGDVGGA
ncbi:hypothetical protein G7Y79_00002g006760 [Physcia stellaris]|nr:hypothetical protein G7Y79_00002g006760 [Physcia stellaris]